MYRCSLAIKSQSRFTSTRPLQLSSMPLPAISAAPGFTRYGSRHWSVVSQQSPCWIVIPSPSLSIVGSRAALELVLDEQVAAVTVTVNEQLAEFPDGSRATNVLVVAPRGNTDPDASPAV